MRFPPSITFHLLSRIKISQKNTALSFQVAECAVASVELAIEALRRSSGDKNDALELLLDPTKREHLDAFLATEAEAAPTLPPR